MTGVTYEIWNLNDCELEGALMKQTTGVCVCVGGQQGDRQLLCPAWPIRHNLTVTHILRIIQYKHDRMKTPFPSPTSYPYPFFALCWGLNVPIFLKAKNLEEWKLTFPDKCPNSQTAFFCSETSEMFNSRFSPADGGKSPLRGTSVSLI